MFLPYFLSRRETTSQKLKGPATDSRNCNFAAGMPHRIQHEKQETLSTPDIYKRGLCSRILGMSGLHIPEQSKNDNPACKTWFKVARYNKTCICSCIEM